MAKPRLRCGLFSDAFRLCCGRGRPIVAGTLLLSVRLAPRSRFGDLLRRSCKESQKEFVRPGIRLWFRRDLAETWAFDVVRIRELLSFFSASLKGMLMLRRTPGSCALGCCVAKSWPFLRPTLRSDFKLLALLDVSYQEERLNKWGHPDRLGTTIWGKDISKHPRLIFCYLQGTPNTSRHLVRSLAYTKFAGWLAQDSKNAEWAWGWVRLRLQHRHHMASPRTVSRTGKWCWIFFRATWRGTA